MFFVFFLFLRVHQEHHGHCSEKPNMRTVVHKLALGFFQLIISGVWTGTQLYARRGFYATNFSAFVQTAPKVEGYH